MEFYRRGRNLGEGVVEVLQLPNHLSVGMQMRELQGAGKWMCCLHLTRALFLCNSADLDAAIAQLVYCKALPFSFGECPYFQRVIDVARSAPRGYKAPKRGLLAGEMLDLAYTTQLE